MKFLQICPLWINGQSGPDLAQNYEILYLSIRSKYFFETLQYDTAQQLAKGDLNIHKSFWTLPKALRSLVYFLVLTHPTITCSKLTIVAKCEIYSKLTIKATEHCCWHPSRVFILNFEHISHHVLLFLLLTLSR